MSEPLPADPAALRVEPEPSPADLAWLQTLIGRSPLLPDAALRAHWIRVLPWVPISARYELAATLRAAELVFETA